MFCEVITRRFEWYHTRDPPVFWPYNTFIITYFYNVPNTLKANISAWQIANPHVAVGGFAICAPNLSVICGLQIQTFSRYKYGIECSNSNLYRIKNCLKNYSSAELCSIMLKFADWRFADQNKKIADFRYADRHTLLAHLRINVDGGPAHIKISRCSSTSSEIIKTIIKFEQTSFFSQCFIYVVTYLIFMCRQSKENLCYCECEGDN
jgi:hypothetical protein